MTIETIMVILIVVVMLNFIGTISSFIAFQIMLKLAKERQVEIEQLERIAYFCN